MVTKEQRFTGSLRRRFVVLLLVLAVLPLGVVSAMLGPRTF